MLQYELSDPVVTQANSVKYEDGSRGKLSDMVVAQFNRLRTLIASPSQTAINNALSIL